MKKPITLGLLLIHQILCKNFSSHSSLISNAIDLILNDFFAKVSPKIDVVHVSGKQSFETEKLISQVLKSKNDSLTFKVIKQHSNDNSKLKLNSSSIIIFDSNEIFKKSSDKIDWQTDSKVQHKHLVHIQDAKLYDLEIIKSQNFSIDNVNFIMHEPIELVSSFMFSQQTCRKNQFVSINRFNKSSMEWETPNFYPNKYRNLHKCRLYYFQRDINAKDSVFGTFARLVNSTPINNERSQSDFIVKGTESFEIIRNQTTVFGYIYLFSKLLFFIPPGELYTPFEKMFLPFEFEVWIAIAITLSSGFVIIQVVNCADSKVRKFVFGRTVQSPTMNFFEIILNGSQVRTAGRNFARFIFTLFVLWCLVIRTCYQSKMFENLQTDPRKAQPKTVKDLFERNFTFLSEYNETVFEVMDGEANYMYVHFII